MENNKFGNRITDNALSADNGELVIAKALDYLKNKSGWETAEDKPLFSGVYYDSRKVGSYIVKVKKDNKKAVLKLQLKPLTFDEGFIIRHINKYNKSQKIKTLNILDDLSWNKELGFGYLVFEDISPLDNLWKSNVTDEKDRELHRNFLKEFFTNTLPIEPWIEKPEVDLRRAYKETFSHFEEIAAKSDYHHIESEKVDEYKKIYYGVVDKLQFIQPHFTHGHLSGKDVKYNQEKKEFILMANLYWSFRPKYYELAFPMWVDIMHFRKKDLNLDEVLERINSWGKLWEDNLYNHNPLNTDQYWFNLLERAMVTIMLDLGASEWKKEEEKELTSLLNVWQELFNWIVNNKFG